MTVTRESELLDTVPGELFVGGTWRASSSAATLPVSNPATGEVIKSVADATPEDGIAALDAAGRRGRLVGRDARP